MSVGHNSIKESIVQRAAADLVAVGEELRDEHVVKVRREHEAGVVVQAAGRVLEHRLEREHEHTPFAHQVHDAVDDARAPPRVHVAVHDYHVQRTKRLKHRTGKVDVRIQSQFAAVRSNLDLIKAVLNDLGNMFDVLVRGNPQAGRV